MTKQVIELHEIETPISTFIAGTLNNACVLFEFKYRKTIDDHMEKKKKLFNADYVYKKNDLHELIEEQIKQYFAGDLHKFSIPIQMKGTDFQMQVWNELLNIPYGQTLSYGQLAEKIGNPQSVRAVGMANGANNIAIIIPCHRVIAANGNLQGYGGGLTNKKKLLQLEKSIVLDSQSEPIDDFF